MKLQQVRSSDDPFQRLHDIIANTMETVEVHRVDNLDHIAVDILAVTDTQGKLLTVVMREISHSHNDAVTPAVNDIIRNRGIVSEVVDEGGMLGRVVQREESH